MHGQLQLDKTARCRKGRRTRVSILQKTCTASKRVTGRQGDANPLRDTTSPPPGSKRQNTHRNYHVLARTWRRWDPGAPRAQGSGAAGTENGVEVPQEVTHGATVRPSNSPPRGTPKTENGDVNRCRHTHAHSSRMPNSQNTDASHASIDGRTDTQNVVWLYTGASRGLTKGGSTDT